LPIVDRWKEYAKKNNKTTTQHQVRRKSSGRADEKKKLLSLATQKAQEDIIEEVIEEMKELYKPSEEELSEMHQAIMNIMKGSINQMSAAIQQQQPVNYKALKSVREMMKAEKKEPSRYNHLEQEGTDAPAVIMVTPTVLNLMNKNKKK